MRANKFLVTISLIFITGFVWSQKIEKLREVTPEDFDLTDYKLPVILSEQVIFTFPYNESEGSAGALDKYFSLRVESFVRIAVSKTNTSDKLFLLPSTFEKGIKISTVKYYYKDKNSVLTRKTELKKIKVVSDSLGFWADFSGIINDPAAILDISFSSESKYKEVLLYYLDSNKIYRDFSLQLYIPEIYSYNIFTVNPCFETNIKEGFNEVRIGYHAETGSREIISKSIADMFTSMFNTRYEPAYCKVNRISLRISDTCSGNIISSPREIINWRLIKITEIK